MPNSEPCPCCGAWFKRLQTHLAVNPTCRAFSEDLENDGSETGKVSVRGDLDAFLESSDACEVADGLAKLKYEHGFQRPDIGAAKKFSQVVGKRARESAYSAMQDLLRPGVDRATFEAGV